MAVTSKLPAYNHILEEMTIHQMDLPNYADNCYTLHSSLDGFLTTHYTVDMIELMSFTF